MKIMHLESSPGWGGQEIRSLKEAIGMRQRGHDVFFVVEKNGGLVENARQAGFVVYEVLFKKKFWFFSFFYLMWLFFKHKIDIVNTHSSEDSWLGGIASRLCGKKILRTRHLSTRIKPGFNSIFLYGFLADFVVTTCQKIVPVICSQAKKDSSLCLSIPTGVNTDLIEKDIEKYGIEEIKEFRKKYGIKETDFLVGTACFMRSWKGIDDFLDAANLLRDEPDLKWVIIGGGHAEKYIKRATQLKLEDKVIFTGHLTDPLLAIKSLAVFALLSTAHEGVSQASLQAAYLQKPIIGTPVGGIPEICIDGKTGVLVPVKSAEDVKNAVLKLKQDKNLCSKMGSTAKKYVIDQFTYEKMLDRMESVYSTILN